MNAVVEPKKIDTEREHTRVGLSKDALKRSADARTYFRWRICGQRERKQPWSLKKAQLPAFSRGKSAALLALEKRQRKGWRHLRGKWEQAGGSPSQSKRNRKGRFSRCSISWRSSQGPVRVLRIKPIAACTPSWENNPASSLEKRAKVLIRCARRMR
jgi:hypothetical protein